MASRSLGTLTYDLVAKIGGFTAGMSEAERAADKSAKDIERSLKSISVASVAVGTAIGSVLADGIRAAANAFPELIDQAAAFQDIADKTGGSAEGFANFAVSAKVAGVEMETIATASTKLSKGLFGVDEESKGAAEGIKALGLNVKDLQALKPDEQLKTVAIAFGNFADGANKAAVAQQIFGKNGAELLKFFKDYVDAGGDANILTAEMIQKADDFADAQTRLKTQISLTATSIAVEFITPVETLTKVFKDAITEAYGLDKAAATLGAQSGVKQFAEEVGRSLAGAIDYIKQSVREFQAITDFVGAYVKAAKEMSFAPVDDFKKQYGLNAFFMKDAAAAGGQATAKTFTQAYNEELKRGQNDRNRALLNASNYGTGGDNRPQLKAPTPKAGGGGRGGARSADKVSEAERYLQSLQKQLEKTNELSAQEQALQDIQMGRLGVVTAAQKEQILNLAGQIDANKQLAQAEKDRLKAEQEAAKAREALMKEGASLTESLRGPLEIWLDDQKRAKELLDAGAISADTYARQVKKIGDAFMEADQPVKDTLTEWDEIMKNFVENTQKSLGDGLYNMLTGNFENIGDQFAKMLLRMAADAAAADIAKKLFGAGVKGGEGEGWLGAILGAVGVSGARATGGPVQPNSMYRVNERGPEVFQAANGNQYLMTGAKGGSVIPNGGGGGGVVIHQNFAPGTDRKTIDQAARSAGLAAQRAIARNS